MGVWAEGEAEGQAIIEGHRERLTRVAASAKVITGGSSAFRILKVIGKVKDFGTKGSKARVSVTVTFKLMVRVDP